MRYFGSIFSTKKSPKLTLWFITFSSFTWVCFFFRLGEILELNFEKLEHKEFWRLFTSPFAVKGLSEVLHNTLMIFLHCFIVESQKGSVMYIFDIITKIILLNGISSFIYYLILPFCSNHQSFLAYYLYLQNVESQRTFLFLFISEVFLILTRYHINRERENSMKIAFILLKIYFLGLVALSFFRIGFVSALIVAIVERMGGVDCFDRLSSSGFVANLERKLQKIDRYVYRKNEIAGVEEDEKLKIEKWHPKFQNSSDLKNSGVKELQLESSVEEISRASDKISKNLDKENRNKHNNVAKLDNSFEI